MSKDEYLQRFRLEYQESPATDDAVLKSYYELQRNFQLFLSPEGMDRDGALLFCLAIPVDLSELESQRRYEDYLHEAKVSGTVRVLGEKTEISPVFRLHWRDPGPHREESRRISTINEPDSRYGSVDLLRKNEGFDVLMKMYVEENGESVRTAAAKLGAESSVRLEAQTRATFNEKRRMPLPPLSIKEALKQHLLRLPEEELCEATNLLSKIYGSWNSCWRQKSTLAVACELRDAVDGDFSSAAEGIREALDGYKPKFVHYNVQVTKELSEEETDDWTYVEGRTSIYDENGNPCAELPFSARPGLHGEPVVTCDWSVRKFWAIDGYGRDGEPVWKKDSLSVRGYREAVDDLLRERQPEIETRIAQEVFRFVERQYFFGRDWYGEGECLRHSIDEVVDLYAQKRSSEWTGIFKKSLEDSLTQELKRGKSRDELFESIDDVRNRIHAGNSRFSSEKRDERKDFSR